MFIYAQINNEFIVVGVSQLSGEVIDNNMIRIDNYDISLLGKTYDSATNSFA